MTREDLISRLSERLGWAEPGTAKALEALIDTVVEELLSGNRVDISDFGLFQTRKQSEYILVDRETNERYLMPPSLEVVFEPAGVASDPALTSGMPYFLPDESLEKEVNSSFALFEPTLLNEGVQFPGIIEVYTDQPAEEDETRDPEEEGAELPRVEPVEEKPLIPGEPAVEEGPGNLDTLPEKKIENEIVKDPPLEEPPVEVLPSEEPPVEEPPVEEPREVPAKKPQPAPAIRRQVRRKPKKKSPVWIPVLGGMAIALSVLFFFKATRSGNAITAPSPPSREDKSKLKPKPKPNISLQQTSRKKVKIEEGKTLRLLAEEHFGHREFWVYIYLENKERISNPNTIPHGMELLLPLPSAHDMSPTDSASIAKAKLLGDEILRAF